MPATKGSRTPRRRRRKRTSPANQNRSWRAPSIRAPQDGSWPRAGTGGPGTPESRLRAVREAERGAAVRCILQAQGALAHRMLELAAVAYIDQVQLGAAARQIDHIHVLQRGDGLKPPVHVGPLPEAAEARLHGEVLLRRGGHPVLLDPILLRLGR